MYPHRLDRTITAQHLRDLFANACAADPCRHCKAIVPCACGKDEVKMALVQAKALLPQLRGGEQRANHADMANAIEGVDRVGDALRLRSLMHRAEACARTARTERDEEQAKAFDQLADAARTAADALPR